GYRTVAACRLCGQPTAQAEPFRVNVDGALPPPGVPRKPRLTWPPLALMFKFQDSFRTVTFGPDWLSMPFHSWVIVWPDGKDDASSQPLIFALLLLVTVISAWKPCPQSLTTS